MEPKLEDRRQNFVSDRYWKKQKKRALKLMGR